LELLDHLADDRHDQRGSDAVEHAVQAAAESVIVQSRQVLLAEAEEVGREEGGPLSHAIDRLAREEAISDQHQQGSHGREFGTGVVLGEMFAEDALQLHSLEDSLQ
jgi:phosphosulfolactate synthase (CoM biosynthesis protein A)